METITLVQFLEGANGLIDLKTCPLSVRGDYRKRNENILTEKKLCERCDGTGNQYMSMYSKCEVCNGTGVEPQ